MKTLYHGLTVLLFATVTLTAQESFSEKSKDYSPYEGLFDYYYDQSQDKIFMEVGSLEKEFLYV